MYHYYQHIFCHAGSVRNTTLACKRTERDLQPQGITLSQEIKKCHSGAKTLFPSITPILILREAAGRSTTCGKVPATGCGEKENTDNIPTSSQPPLRNGLFCIPTIWFCMVFLLHYLQCDSAITSSSCPIIKMDLLGCRCK